MNPNENNTEQSANDNIPQTQNQNTAETRPEGDDKNAGMDTAGSEKHTGGIIGAVIIVIIIILGGLYFWGKQLNDRGADNAATAEEITGAADKQVEALEQQGSSDAVADITSDLDATSLDNLDAELNSIEKELAP